jgi:hypothetical protein
MTHARSDTRRGPLAMAALFAGLALLGAGCGSGTGTVAGKVYYKDQIVPGGTVVFTNTDGKGSRTSRIGADGSYKIEDMPAGNVKIAIETESIKPAAPSGQAPGRGAPNMPMPPADKIPAGVDPSKYYSRGGDSGEKYVQIPGDYSDPNTSGETYVVKKGPQEHDLRLK